MATTTLSKTGLKKQDKGDTDWHTPLNSGFDTLEGRIEKSNSGDPNGSVTSDWASQGLRDTNNGELYVSLEGGTQNWRRVGTAAGADLSSDGGNALDKGATAAQNNLTNGLQIGGINVEAREVAHIRDEKSRGTNGGAAGSDTTQIRDLNTVAFDDIGISLNSNKVALPAGGKYRVMARAPAQSVDRHKLMLTDATNGGYILTGSSQYAKSSNNVHNDSWVIGEITPSSSISIKLDHYTEISKTSTGLGVSTSTFTETEVYAELWLERIE